MALRATKSKSLLPLAARFTEAPRLLAPKTAAAKLDEALAGSGKKLAREFAVLFKKYPRARRILEGLAEGSPFLWEVAQADLAGLRALLAGYPEQGLARIIHRIRAARAAKSEAAVMRTLRKSRRDAALLVALTDIGGAWTLAEVTHALTAIADAAVGVAVDFLLLATQRTGKLKLKDPKRPGEGSGFFALAMGKFGAGELNYSSDIDLILLYDPHAKLNGLDPAPFFIRLARDLVRMLQERTPDGYVFRVDLRLRPDPGSTQLAVATDFAAAYYEREGQTWERAAFIKARPCAGDIEAGTAFLNELSPFVWRRYLDYAAIADVHAMKRQIHAFRGHEQIAVAGHNIKLGRGGIREIEFFVQTQQLIAGGRSPALRMPETLKALDTLAAERWISAEARDELTAAYVYLRRVEHRLQMVADEQTHTLPAEPDALERFARFFGATGSKAFAKTLVAHLRRVQGHYGRLFEDAPPLATIEGKLAFPADADDREALETLSRLGFRNPRAASDTVRGWLVAKHRSLRPEAARADLQTILPALLDALARTGNADAALVAADRFFTELPGSIRLLAALRTHPDLVQLLGTIFGTAPRLAEIVAPAPSVLDGLLDPAFFGEPPGAEILAKRLDIAIKDALDEEEFLDRVRRFGREHLVLIGVRVLSGALSAARAGEAYTALAEVVIRTLHRAVSERFAAQHGRIKRGESAVLAMGKLGGREMTAGSDLDFLLLYDFDPKHPESNGPRPLHATEYYARLTKRLVSALTTPTNAGKLYDVDLRLRPSGRSGPIATAIESFRIYQREEAWTWEHMALTRGRVVSAPSGFKARVEKEIGRVLRMKRDAAMVCRDAAEMRRAIAAEKGEGSRWDFKSAAGGLTDIEFIAQYLQLVHAASRPEILNANTGQVLAKAQSLGLLDTADSELLRGAWQLYADLGQILRLCLSKPFDPKQAGPGLLTLLARAAGLPDFATLDAHLKDTQKRVRACFKRLLEVE
jgi:glutamate-ammonia-ligase adenylyltransferase